MNSDRQLHLSVEEHRARDLVVRDVKLKADGEREEIVVRYEIFDPELGDLSVLDGLVQGILLHAMSRGRPLRVHGDLSASAVHNLHEFQRAWVRWRPLVYRHVDLLPDAVVSLPRSSDRVIQAFSGGVDASFTLVSNKYLHVNRGAYDVTAGLLVHGFDVPYEDRSTFTKLADRVRRTLDEAGVAIKLVRTNSKALGLQSWLDSCAPQLGACLHQFSDRYGTALIGSAEPYDALWLPIGTNPILDPLLSGDRMGVVHDGAAYSRTEKVEAIAQFPFVVDRLKVCWQGPRGYENCGRCEKCLRTRLNFAAAGYNEPSCFPGSFETRSLRKLRAQTPIQIAELDNILAYVRRRKLSYPWVAALRRRILLSRIAIPIERATRWRAVRSRLRSTVKSWLAPSPQPRA